MSESLHFIKWCYNKVVANVKSWDHWMWAWMITCAWGPSAFMNRAENPVSYNLFVLFVFAFWIMYGVLFTSVKRAWRNYQEEKVKVLNILKEEK